MRTKVNVSIAKDTIKLAGKFSYKRFPGAYKIYPGDNISTLILHLGDTIIIGYESYSYRTNSITINKKRKYCCTFSGIQDFYLIDKTSVMLAVTASTAARGAVHRCKY